MACKESTTSPYDEIWNLLNKYKFDIDMGANADLICAICNMILKNAYQNSCGCKYCLECVMRSWNKGALPCPGKHEACNRVIISSIDNLNEDNSANRRISHLVVQCPEQNCDVSDELRRMSEHIQSHDERCPYFELGCYTSLTNNDAIEHHLNLAALSHTHLLTHSIQNLKNEIQCLKEKFEKEFNTHRALIDCMEKLRKSFRELVKKQKREMYDSTSDNLVTDESDSGSYYSNDDNSNLVSTTSSIADNGLHFASPFRWNIDQFSRMKRFAKQGLNQLYTSDPFYSNIGRYLMQLIIYPNGCLEGIGTHISVFFKILKGNYDDSMLWPMPHAITISIIDQQSGEWHTSYSTCHDSVDENCRLFFHRYSRKKGRNHFGASKFFMYDRLIRNDRLYRNDRIVLTCHLSQLIDR